MRGGLLLVMLCIAVQVQIRPWKLSDSQALAHTTSLDARLLVYVAAVPRPLKASELASVFDAHFFNVCYAAIDVDQDLKYPKGEKLPLPPQICFDSFPIS